ncbi:MAG: hypothetical protein JNK58_00745 [Phycisphaerae bacterium]|nr:hypothetical protein [Phycisphaerae bacterium]
MARARITSSRFTVPVLGLLTLLFLIGLSIPGVTPWYLGPVAVAQSLLSAAPFATAYLLAAWGFGLAAFTLLMHPAPAAAGNAADSWKRKGVITFTLQLSLGLALLLSVSHLMGVFGLLRIGAAGLVLAWLPIALGLALLAWNTANRLRPSIFIAPANRSPVLLAAAPALATLFLAVCVPPGTLWASEARGFDVLSYHLQLPREWLAAGRIQPLEHNAYSWLPSYMEAAYMHLGAMASFIARDPFTEADGVATIASQLLHALIAIASAGGAAALASTLLIRLDLHADRRLFASAFTALLFLTTPWVIVTGSLAYNEMTVCLFLAASLIACELASLSPVRRGVIVGLVVGAACCAKPTALFMVGAPVGAWILLRTPRRESSRMLAAAASTGLLTLSPWLTRNAIASGNPVFPYLTSYFGDGHWSALEVARWTLGHHESAGVFGRLSLFVSDRGVVHEQYWFVVPFAVALLGPALLWRRSRPMLMPLAVVLMIQVILWLSIGHLQSRFLISTVVPLIAGVGVFWVGTRAEARSSSRKWIALLCWCQSFNVVARLMLSEAIVEDRPAAGFFAASGINAITGESSRAAFDAASAEDQQELKDHFFGPFEWVNLVEASAIRRLYLLGDSTPFYYHVPVLYHTTWDPSPLGSLLRESSGRLAGAVGRLAAPSPAGLGVSHVLINFSELRRLHSDRWYDPDVTPTVAESLLQRHGRIIKEWQPANGARIVLIELIPASP